MVPRAGLEPARANAHRILSPACLPIPPPRHILKTQFSILGEVRPPQILIHIADADSILSSLQHTQFIKGIVQ